mmetsp:Transcript_4710/g.9100  ORF Transcript_4710/g.9100 Transcript_4710/m.9100 type:complete len:89 (-) Transcript_4710:557-823(-)
MLERRGAGDTRVSRGSTSLSLYVGYSLQSHHHLVDLKTKKHDGSSWFSPLAPWYHRPPEHLRGGATTEKKTTSSTRAYNQSPRSSSKF